MFTFPVTLLGSGEFAASGEWVDLQASVNAVGGIWSDPENVLVSDDAWAIQNGAASGFPMLITDLKKKIPDGVTIAGIEVRFECHKSVGASVAVPLLQLTKNGSVGVGSVKTGSTPPDTTDAYQTVGGAADLWGTTWTSSEINAGNFGVRLGETVLSGIVYIDHVQIAITY